MGGAIQQVVEDMADHPLSVDHIGDAAWQQPQHRGHTEGLPQAIAPINQQRKREVVALGEALVAAGTVAAHAPYLRSQRLDVAVAVSEGAGLHGAARGVVLGIEEEHQGAAVEPVAAALLALLVGQIDQGGAVAGAQTHGQGYGGEGQLCSLESGHSAPGLGRLAPAGTMGGRLPPSSRP